MEIAGAGVGGGDAVGDGEDELFVGDDPGGVAAHRAHPVGVFVALQS